MRYYLAPLEGITTYIYRNAYDGCFAPMDKYFSPFLVPHTKKGFSARELREILPEHNEGLYLVPQILSNDAEGFLQTVKKLEGLGYREVNLNLGCPSKTVVSKYRGAGFLAKPEELERFLDRIYSEAGAEISIKTRIGKFLPEEFEGLLKIYNKYPVKELIIHPRVQQDFYKNTPRLEIFEEAVRESKNPLCYNGDIFRREDYKKIYESFPTVPAVMLGRGIIGNPGLLEEITGKGAPNDRRLRRFHDRVLEGYMSLRLGDKNVLFKMKEIWSYMGCLFPDGERQLKKIKKAERICDYKAAVEELFSLYSVMREKNTEGKE